jgi:hypothetical protein
MADQAGSWSSEQKEAEISDLASTVAHNWEKQHHEETAFRNITFGITKKDPPDQTQPNRDTSPFH